jgi:hypothetical protein
MSITKNEKVAQVLSRVRELERLADPPTFESQLKTWGAQDKWAGDVVIEINNMVALLNTLIEETKSGS